MRRWVRGALVLVGLAAGAVGYRLGRLRNGLSPEPLDGLSPEPLDVRTVFDHLEEGVVLLDRDRTVILINRSACGLLGLESARHRIATMTQTFGLSLYDGTPVPFEQWPSARALRGEFLTDAEFRIRHLATGRVATVLLSTVPIRDGAGRTRQVMVVYRDITERREQEALRTRLVAIVESSEDAIVGKDEWGTVTSWNLGAEKIFGYTSVEMVGQSIKLLLPPDRQNEEDEILARIRQGKTLDHVETTRIRRDGTPILVSLTISPIRDANGQIIGASKVARDITEQKRLELQAQQSQKMEAIGQLTGGIAHDFNNLLGVVMGNLDLLEPLVAEQEPAMRRLRTAQKAAVRGADLTRRLLAFSSKEELNPKLTSLEHTIRNALELAQRALGPEIRMVVRIDRTVPDVVIDRSGLETVLLNLFVNSRDAMPDGGTLTVSAQETCVASDAGQAPSGDLKPGGYVCVTISDTGHGMTQEVLARVFEPFFTTKPRGRGTGLGLAMAYGFARQSGGTVRIYSEPGYGTSVSLYLPVPAVVGRAALPEAEPSAPEADPAGCVVLIVDDEEDLLDIAAAYVQEMGCRSLQALDGASALAILEGPEPIQLMMTDIVMPGGMNGATLAARARVLRPAMKIIYSSGFPADALEARTSLALDGPLLRKPYRRAEVQAFVRRAMSDSAQSPGEAA